MEIKKLANISLNFIIKRFIELFGLVIFVISIFLLISLISYSPKDQTLFFLKIQKFKISWVLKAALRQIFFFSL